MLQLTIKKERVGPVRGRHPWVFSGAIQQIPDGIESGTSIQLVDPQGQFLASGYFNSYSQIAVRVWSWNSKEEVDDDFFVRRIKQAYELRRKFVESKETDSYRLIYGENDFLPGLIVDKYADYLSVQFHNRGIEFWKDKIVGALNSVIKPKGIYERSDVRDRNREEPPLAGGPRGVLAEKHTGLLSGHVPEKVQITENGFKFWVDIIGGQKTGFFLDQRDKRQAIIKYVKDKTVLNCFSYTGGFSVYALAGGAKKVVSVDVSEPALALAEENMKLNKFPAKKTEFIAADVMDYLRCHCEEAEGQRSNPLNTGGLPQSLALLRNDMFDVIIVDPPAFIKDRHKIREGLHGYRKVNEMAMRLLPPGGILVSCSCSAHLSLQDFRFMLSEAAGRAGRTLQILETFTHGIDHPQLVAFTEGEYLKVIFAQIN